MTELDLDEIEARANAATPGPWEAYFTLHGDPMVVEQGQGPFGAVTLPSTAPDDYGKANAEFIAHAREDIPALVQRVRELEQTLAFFADPTIVDYIAPEVVNNVLDHLLLHFDEHEPRTAAVIRFGWDEDFIKSDDIDLESVVSDFIDTPQDTQDHDRTA
jgi:hypothetical protein